MIQNVKKKKRVAGGRRSSQFFIEMDARGILLFLTMVLLTVAVVFYLGFIFGKATRNPNDPRFQRKPTIGSKSSDRKTLSKKDLNIYNIKEDKKKTSTLTRDAKDAMKKVDQLVKGSQSTVKSVSKTLADKKPSPQKAAIKPASPKPAVSGSSDVDKSGKLYTIQVFATRNELRAGDIVKGLKQKGFEAYMVEAISDGKKMYRVRVGKQPKAGITSLMKRLEKVIAGLDIKPKMIQVD